MSLMDLGVEKVNSAMAPKYVARSTNDEGTRGSAWWVQCVSNGTPDLDLRLHDETVIVRSQAKERGFTMLRLRTCRDILKKEGKAYDVTK